MIYIDTSESRANTTMPNISSAIEVDNLEELTGADIMVSPIQMPATTETLIKKHLANGALLVQRKHGHDLPSSVGNRLNSSLGRMQNVGATQSQCILLFIGVLTANTYEEAVINRKTTRQNYWIVQAALSKWHDRGGVVEHLPRKSMIEPWCNMKLRHLDEYKESPTKEVWKSKPHIEEMDDFLQVLQLVTDARNTLASLPGIGPKMAQTLWDEFDGRVAEALCWLTNPERGKIAGIGPKTTENVREWLGLEKANWMSLETFEQEDL